MSWIKQRPLIALAALALALRVAGAAVTELHPIFPAYYYTDAAMIHGYAVSALDDIRAGRPPTINGALSERIQTAISLAIYLAAGPRPLMVKLFNAFLGSLAVAAFAWALAKAFPTRAALAAGFLMAVWPSHVFYTSQNLKEAPVALMAYAGIGAAFAAGFAPGRPRPRAAAWALCAAAALLAAGFYRSYVLMCLGSALLGAIALEAWRPPRANALLTAAVLLAVLAIYPALSRRLLASFPASPLGASDADRIRPGLIPVTYSADYRESYRPTSPANISRFRTARQTADRDWAGKTTGREIGTQIYPGETFESWLDVAFYLPKAAFTVLFMPLPGLYPLEGKAGRRAAAAENTALLVLALLAAAGFARSPKTPARLCLLAFFTAMTAGAAFLEFDLGSAGRHKLLYLPMLFPFAAGEAFRLLNREELP